jgi:hypothetical protein
VFGAEAFGELYFAEGPGPIGRAVAGLVRIYSIAKAAVAASANPTAAVAVADAPAAAVALFDEQGAIPL